MKWSLRLGRILGIDVYIHLTFLLLLGFVGLANWLTDRSVEAAVGGVVFFVSRWSTDFHLGLTGVPLVINAR